MRRTECGDCGATDIDIVHACRVADLPPALVRDMGHSIRETAVQGRGLWKEFTDEGVKVAYFVGATWGADKDALYQAIEAADEEMRVMMAEAAAEFGF